MTHKLLIYGSIPFDQNEPNSTLKIKEQLAGMDFSKDKVLHVGINSPGGDVEQGFAIYNALREFAKEKHITIETEIEGECASIATVIFMAGDRRVGNEMFKPFVHSAWIMPPSINQQQAEEYALQLADINDRIATLYASVTKGTKEEFLQLMRNETNIDTNSALTLNFFHEVKKVNNPKNMASKQQIMNRVREILGIYTTRLKNLNVNTADMRVVEVQTESTDIAVGDKVVIDGKPVNEPILLEDGRTIVCENGVIIEIVTKEDIANAPIVDETNEPTIVMANFFKETVDKMQSDFNAFIESSKKEIESQKNQMQTAITMANEKIEVANKVIERFNALAPNVVNTGKKENNSGASALDKYR